MRPDKTIDEFPSAGETAIELAAEVCLVAGYDGLMSGLPSAMVDLAAGHSLAEELVSHCKPAIENYKARYG